MIRGLGFSGTWLRRSGHTTGVLVWRRLRMVGGAGRPWLRARGEGGRFWDNAHIPCIVAYTFGVHVRRILGIRSGNAPNDNKNNHIHRFPKLSSQPTPPPPRPLKRDTYPRAGRGALSKGAGAGARPARGIRAPRRRAPRGLPSTGAELSTKVSTGRHAGTLREVGRQQVKRSSHSAGNALKSWTKHSLWGRPPQSKKSYLENALTLY